MGRVKEKMINWSTVEFEAEFNSGDNYMHITYLEYMTGEVLTEDEMYEVETDPDNSCTIGAIMYDSLY